MPDLDPLELLPPEQPLDRPDSRLPLELIWLFVLTIMIVASLVVAVIAPGSVFNREAEATRIANLIDTSVSRQVAAAMASAISPTRNAVGESTPVPQPSTPRARVTEPATAVAQITPSTATPTSPPQLQLMVSLAFDPLPSYYDIPVITITTGTPQNGVSLVISSSGALVVSTQDGIRPVELVLTGIVDRRESAISGTARAIGATQFQWSPLESGMPIPPGDYLVRLVGPNIGETGLPLKVREPMRLVVVNAKARNLPLTADVPGYVAVPSVTAGQVISVVNWLKPLGTIAFLQFPQPGTRRLIYIPVGVGGSYDEGNRYVTQLDGKGLSEDVLKSYFGPR